MYLSFTFVTLHQHNKTCKLCDLEIKKEKFNEILPPEWLVRRDLGLSSQKAMLLRGSASAIVPVLGLVSRKVRQNSCMNSNTL